MTLTETTFTLEPDDHARAAEAFVRDATEAAETRVSGSVFGAIERFDDALSLLFFRGCLLFIALAGIAVLLLRSGTRTLGVVLVVLLPFAIWGYLRAERAVRGGVRRVDAAMDDALYRYGGREVAEAIRTGRRTALVGEVTVSLDDRGDGTAPVLRCRTREHEVSIPLAGHVVRGRTERHLIVSARVPRRPDDLSSWVLVPVGTELATFVTEAGAAATSRG